MVRAIAEADPVSLGNSPSLAAETLRRLKSEASAVLAQLVDAKQATEAHLARERRSDVLKTVTGESSLDRAIQEVRSRIAELAERLDRLEGVKTPVVAVPLGRRLV
ncbi:MAG: hypothetical protein IBJ11_06860 [Phycisphaerales bacterium]|nr:hypothetical protein [Phycisphaerales bacterium]